jgi:hypothetical protein
MHTPTLPSALATGVFADALAHDIAAHGIDQLDGDVARFVALARSTDASPQLIDLLLDRAATSIARERAFGRLAAQLATIAAADQVLTVSPVAWSAAA